MCSSPENGDKLTKPSRGDHWINGLSLDGKDFEGPANFSNGFPSFFPKIVHWGQHQAQTKGQVI